MKKKTLNIVKILIFFSIGIGIIYWMYGYKLTPQERTTILETLKSGVNYFWVFLSLLIGLISHISRTMRWRIMVEPIGKKPKFMNTFLAVMVGYVMNMVIPRMGEVSRCGVLYRYEKISFSKSFGTVVAERIVDLISLLVLLGIVIISQFGKMLDFFERTPQISEKLVMLVTTPWLYIAVILVFILLFVFRKSFSHTVLYSKIKDTIINIKAGFLSIRNMKKKGWFFFHSVFIWVMYYLMLYVNFFAFDFTRDLSPIAGLTTFVLASFGMVAPVQGGFGPWHFMAQTSLELYGVNAVNASTFALLVHTSMTAMIILIGVISIQILPFVNRKMELSVESNS